MATIGRDYSLSAFNFQCIYVFGTYQGGFLLAYINFKSGRLKKMGINIEV